MTDKDKADRSLRRSAVPAGAQFAAVLKASPLFATLSEESLSLLSAGLQVQRWPRGALIFARGDPGDYMLVVTAGRIRLSLSSPEGREIVLTTIGAGEILGEMALIDGQPRSADATAVAATTCLKLSRTRFEAGASQRPDIGLALARHLAQRLRRTNFQMESIALYDLQARLVRYLLHMLAQRPEPGLWRRLDLGLSQAEIAAVLGASRPKVNMALGALSAAGAIRREGSALLCNVGVLGAMTDSDLPPD